jgi:hypothetical protein
LDNEGNSICSVALDLHLIRLRLDLLSSLLFKRSC